jgi:hypothetical protein
VHGDFAGGDKIVFSDLGGSSGVAIGRGAQSLLFLLANLLQQLKRTCVIWLDGQGFQEALFG